MKPLIITLLTLSLFSTVSAQNADKVRELEQRIQKLEEQMKRMEHQAYNAQRDEHMTPEVKKMMENARKRTAADRDKFGQDDIAKAEKMYETASHNLSSEASRELLRSLVTEYPGLNRAGCAQLYLAQHEHGTERERLLKDCIKRFADCYYFDGTQVGPYAMLQLGYYYQQLGDEANATKLFNKIRSEYPEAIDHSAKLLVDQVY